MPVAQIPFSSDDDWATRSAVILSLVGSLTHDFNNLLTGVLGNLRLAIEDLGDDHPVSGQLQRAEKTAERMADLVRQQATLCQASIWSRSLVTVASIVETAIQRSGSSHIIWLDQTKGAELEVDPGPVVFAIRCLLQNAVEAAPGREITVSGAEVTFHAKEIRYPWASPGRFVRIAVQDQGGGFRPDLASQAFQPFVSSKIQHEGLGLSMTFVIAKQHAGWVEVESTTSGATVSLYLPCVE